MRLFTIGVAKIRLKGKRIMLRLLRCYRTNLAVYIRLHHIRI